MSEDVRTRRPPPSFRRGRVVERRDRSPWLVTVTLKGPELDGFTVAEPGASVRLLLPRDGAGGQLEIPTWTGNEYRDADGERATVRTLTPLAAGPGRLRLEVVRHGAGPLSTWVDEVSLGEEVAVSGPGRGYAIDPAAGRFLVAGDETALPAIGQLLEAMPTTAIVDVIVEIAHPDARVPLPEHPGATITWGRDLVGAVAAHDIPLGTRIWAAGEAAAMQRLRTLLAREGRRPRDHLVIRGYWKDKVVSPVR